MTQPAPAIAPRHLAAGGISSIWLFAFGYFACYVPYTALTKALSKGLLGGEAIAGATLLPLTTAVCAVVMLAFLALTGWWRFASRHQVGPLSIPGPTRWTLLSGLCTAVILTTTTLAYTFDGVSIVFVMLLMRGGVLTIAPLVDWGTGRRPKWYAWVGLGLCFAALVVAFSDSAGYDITLPCLVDIALYLSAYFVRLRFMSKLAKSADPNVTKRYFAEEQLVATPASLAALAAIALLGEGAFAAEVRTGFTAIGQSPMLGQVLLVGLLSQGVGIFGTLIFLDKSDNTFAVPVNRCSSILAGVVASFVLTWWLSAPLPGNAQLVGAAMVVSAIAVLSLGPRLGRRGG